MLARVNLCGAEISRLIVGGNPFSGNSHVSREMDSQMEDYFTASKIKETLFNCEKHGIKTMQLRGDKHIMRIIREYRQEGGKMNWIAQTAPEFGSFEGNVAQMAAYKPAAIYHHGTVTDELFKNENYDELVRRLAVIRKTGLPVGLCTHMPSVIRYAQEHKWDVDFYMASVFNLSRAERVSSAVTGVANEDEPFFEEDIPLMYEVIREVDKPCIAFKILGATRRCQNQESVRSAFFEAYASIKPGDAVIVGVYPKEIDQIALNCSYTNDAIEAAGMI